MFLQGRGYVPAFEVIGDAGRRRLYAVKATVDGGQALGNVEKRIGLLLDEYFLEPVVGLLALLAIKAAARAVEQVVDFLRQFMREG